MALNQANGASRRLSLSSIQTRRHKFQGKFGTAENLPIFSMDIAM
jgi:hypothetical protein